MFLVSIFVLAPVLLLAAGRELPPEVLDQIDRLVPLDTTIGQGQLAASFAAGLAVAGTPLHVVVRYLSTVVHELGHAFTAGLLGGRPKNITISLDA
ncbi:MAG: M50 family metallopeptidase, partial [Actinomycetota bacterium]